MSKKILAFVMALVLVCSLVPAVAAAETEVRFEFGANGSAEHVDGNAISATKTFNEGGYQLTLTGCSKVYDGAFDAQGNSCLKMGTSSAVGTFTFTVPEGINEVVIYAAKYKAKNTKLDVNGTEYTLSKSSDDGQYEEIVVDTSATKSVTVATLSNNWRTMINAIVLRGEAGSAPTVPETPPVVAPTDPAEIVKAAYALEPGASLPYTATLTGTITEVTEEYSTQYKNITVIFVVDGCDDMPIKCYRLKGTGADQIGVGDTITVTGTIVNYVHSSGDSEVEFNSGCTLDSWTDGGSTTPSEPEETTPTTPVVPGEIAEISVADAVALGEEMEHDHYTSEQYKITGTIAEISNATYGNMYITDGNGNYLYIYGTYNADGTVAYADMEVKPVVGDIVTIQGAIGNYSKAAQIKNGWIVEHTVGEPPATEPVEEPDAVLDFSTTDNRVSQTTEKQVWQQNGITVTNDKASSTTDIINSSNPVRFYKSSKITIEATGMTKILIACNNLQYADALVASIPTVAGVSVSQKISDVTIEFSEAVDSFAIETLSGGQVRVDSIGVYLAGGEEEGIVGDINGDTSVNNDDVVLLLWHTLFADEYPLTGDVDLNNDGSVNNDDVVLLLWHTLFPEEYPL